MRSSTNPVARRSASKAEAADEFFDSLVYEAIRLPGDHGVPQKDIQTPFISKEEVKEAQRFFWRNYSAVMLAITVAEILQAPIGRITGFVLRSDNYKVPQAIYLRGVLTFTHIRNWFRADILDKVKA